MRLERDDARSPYQAVEDYLSEHYAAERPPVSEQHAAELRAVRFSGEVTIGMVDAIHREMRARDRGKTVTRGQAIGPVDVPEGRRRIAPGKRG